jgi:tetratricopeptide (TPR) repeat protein
MCDIKQDPNFVQVECQKTIIELHRCNGTGDYSRMSYLYGLLGDMYEISGRANEAQHYYTEQWSTACKADNLTDVANAMGNCAGILAYTGDWRAAIELYCKQEAIAHQLGDLLMEGMVYINTAAVFRQNRHHEDAIKFAKDGLALAMQTKNSFGIQKALCILIELSSGHELEQYRRQMRDHHSAGNPLHRTVQACMYNIDAKLCIGRGTEADALQAHACALNIYTQLGDRVKEGSTYLGIAMVYAKHGKLDLARHFYGKSFTIATDRGDYFGLSAANDFRHHLESIQSHGV